MDDDFMLAAQLQIEEEMKARENKEIKHQPKSAISIVDPIWENVDPTPNIHSLFQRFDAKFFRCKLGSVEVKWSPRMTSCAGICTYKGRGGCIISLSLPLLKLRPRKDLVETLLHEMIHAYLFLTKNNKDRDGHGPEFQKHMNRINQESGTKITIYHSFHDEVRLYKTHWWRCDGPCREQKPFYGMVKRAMNRAPGPNDFWFAEHQARCGGHFTKIKEPEGFKSRKGKKIESNKNLDSYFHIETPKKDIINKSSDTQSISKGSTSQKGSRNGIKDNALPKSSVTKGSTNRKIDSYFKTPIKKGNIHGFSIPKSSKDENSTTSTVPFSGAGHVLSTSNSDRSKSRLLTLSDNFDKPLKKLKTNDGTALPSTSKIGQINQINCPVCNDSIGLNDMNEHLDVCSSLDSVFDESNVIVLNDTDETDPSCPVCNSKIPINQINQHLDQCVGVEECIEINEDVVQCPCCGIKCSLSNINDHIDNCVKV